MSTELPFVDALGVELYEAAVRRMSPQAVARRRRRRLLAPIGATMVVVAVAISTVLAVARPDTAQADVRIEVADGRVFVTLVDLEHRPERIEEAVRRAGLDVSVVAVPVGPSEVGRFVGSVTSDLPPELRVLEGGQSTFAGFSLPAGWSGSLDLEVGRPARDGETYAAFSDAFAPGEPLACTDVVGVSARASLARFAAIDLHVVFLPVASDEAGGPVVEAADLAQRGLDDWVVVDANATSADHLLVRIQDPATPGPPAPSRPRC